jgi:hypothetical protein
MHVFLLPVRTVIPRAYLIGLWRTVPAHICTLYRAQPKYVFRYRIHITKARWRGTHGGEGATNSSKTKYYMYQTGMLAHGISVLGLRYCSSSLPIKYDPVSRDSHRCHRWERYTRNGPQLSMTTILLIITLQLFFQFNNVIITNMYLIGGGQLRLLRYVEWYVQYPVQTCVNKYSAITCVYTSSAVTCVNKSSALTCVNNCNNLWEQVVCSNLCEYVVLSKLCE